LQLAGDDEGPLAVDRKPLAVEVDVGLGGGLGRENAVVAVGPAGGAGADGQQAEGERQEEREQAGEWFHRKTFRDDAPLRKRKAFPGVQGYGH